MYAFPLKVTVDTKAIIVSKDTIKKVEAEKTEVKKEITEPEKHKSGYASYFSKIDNGRKTLCFFVPFAVSDNAC